MTMHACARVGQNRTERSAEKAGEKHASRNCKPRAAVLSHLPPVDSVCQAGPGRSRCGSSSTWTPTWSPIRADALLHSSLPFGGNRRIRFCASVAAWFCLCSEPGYSVAISAAGSAHHWQLAEPRRISPDRRIDGSPERLRPRIPGRVIGIPRAQRNQCGRRNVAWHSEQKTWCRMLPLLEGPKGASRSEPL